MLVVHAAANEAPAALLGVPMSGSRILCEVCVPRASAQRRGEAALSSTAAMAGLACMALLSLSNASQKASCPPGTAPVALHFGLRESLVRIPAGCPPRRWPTSGNQTQNTLKPQGTAPEAMHASLRESLVREHSGSSACA